MSMFTKDVVIPLAHNPHPMSAGKVEAQFLHGRTRPSCVLGNLPHAFNSSLASY